MFSSCETSKQSPIVESALAKVEIKPKNIKYGFDIDQFRVVKKKIRRGDTFGSILEDNGIDYPEVYNILKALKNKVRVRRLVVGKSYSLFFSKDSIPTPKAFIYETQIDSYTLVQLRDSIYGKKVTKPIKILTKEGNGLIENSLYELINLYENKKLPNKILLSGEKSFSYFKKKIVSFSLYFSLVSKVPKEFS